MNSALRNQPPHHRYSLSRTRGLTILFTEHDMGVVFGIAKRISVLHQGTLIADGFPQEVRNSEEVQKVYLGGTA